MVRQGRARAMSSYRFFTIDSTAEATIVRAVDPYLQGTTLAELLRLELLQIVDSSPSKTLFIVDFQNVKLVSSSVISSLLAVQRHLLAEDRMMKLCSMTASLRHVFKTLNMDGTVFQIFESVENATTSGARATSYYDICEKFSPPDEENP